MSDNDTRSPWEAYLESAERNECGDGAADDPEPERPDRGWRRLGAIVEEAFAGIIAAGGFLLALGAIVYSVQVVGR